MIEPKDVTHVYVGDKPCGCRVAAVIDRADSHTADSVAGFIKSGYSVQRLSLPDYRTVGLTRCKCNRTPEAA